MSSRWLDTYEDFCIEVSFLCMDQEEVNVYKNAKKEQFPTKLTLETCLVKTGFIILAKTNLFFAGALAL